MAADKERDPGSSSAEIGKYLDILAKDPKSRVFAPLAEAYRKAGLLDDAVATALEGLRIHPNYLGGRVALGRAYFEKKQYAEAAIEMEKVAKAAPDNIIAHRVLGQIADSRNDLPAAEKAFKMVLLLDPRDLEAREFIESLKGPAPSPPPAPPAQSAPPAPPAPPTLPTPTPSLAFDEIQEIEDLDLQAEEMIVAPPPAPLPQALPQPQSMSSPPSAAPAPPPSEQIWPETEPPPPSQPAPPQPDRPLSSAPPQPSPAPILAPEPPTQEEQESIFEQFTRDPGPRAAPPPARAERGKTQPRELDLETTAYAPPDFDLTGDLAAEAPTPDEELPRVEPPQETHTVPPAREPVAFVG